MSPDPSLFAVNDTTRLGVYRQPGQRAAYPELHTLLLKIYRDRVAKLPFVPGYWMGGVMALMDANPDDLIQLSPVATANGTPIIGDVPVFVGSDAAKRKAWQVVVDVMTSAKMKFVEGKLDEGRAEMEAAYASAEFWDTLYNVAVAARDAVPNAIGWTVGKFWEGLDTKWRLALFVAALAGGTYLIVKLGGVRTIVSKAKGAVTG